MAEEGQPDPVGQFAALRTAAASYFEAAAPQVEKAAGDSAWDALAPETRGEALQVIAGLADLATGIGPAIRRSPLLSAVDATEAGRAIKGMRAALRFRRFVYWDPSILHDEDIVLGVRPGGESDDQFVNLTDARDYFKAWADWLNTRLDLIDPHAGGPTGSELLPPRAVASGYRPNSAFIMMWMDNNKPELVDLSNTIKTCFAAFDVVAVRSDDIEHQDVITQRIIDELKTAEFLIADLTGERPSVYYEIGVAHALGKRPILFRHAGTDVHFDLAHFNCPEYTNLTDLTQRLVKRLQALTGREPKKTAINAG